MKNSCNVRQNKLKCAMRKKKLTIVLSELNVDSEHVPSNLSWHFLCTAVWHAKNIEKKNYERKKNCESEKKEANH